MKVKRIGNTAATEIESGNLTILFSYETPVAVWDRHIGDYFITEKKHSVTTSKHINRWIRSHGKNPPAVTRKPQEWFNRLVTICETADKTGMKITLTNSTGGLNV